MKKESFYYNKIITKSLEETWIIKSSGLIWVIKSHRGKKCGSMNLPLFLGRNWLLTFITHNVASYIVTYFKLSLYIYVYKTIASYLKTIDFLIRQRVYSPPVTIESLTSETKWFVHGGLQVRKTTIMFECTLEPMKTLHIVMFFN